MNWAIVAFVVFTLCLLLIAIHYGVFGYDARATRRYIDEKRRKGITRPFDLTEFGDSNDDKEEFINAARRRRTLGRTFHTNDMVVRDDDNESSRDDNDASNAVDDVNGVGTTEKENDNNEEDNDRRNDGSDENGGGEEHPDYPNPLVVLERTTTPPEKLNLYRLRVNEDDSSIHGTRLFERWWRDTDEYVAMFRFQDDVMSFVATDDNNAIGTIDAYVRCVAVLRDFALRFLGATTTGVTNGAIANVARSDWRLFVTTATNHFARCLYFVNDASVRDVSRRCFVAVARDPYSIVGRSFDSIDPVTAYRVANAWILAKRSTGSNDWIDNENYRLMLTTLREKMSVLNQWLYYEPPKIDTVVRLRDNGRLLQGRIPFYGDLWHRYVYIRDVRQMDRRVDRMVLTMSDFACLRLLLHAQVRYSCFGLFGPGLVIPSYWLWPVTDVGLAVIPSIGFMRMYEQRYSWSCRIFKEDQPFYSYRTGRFDPIHAHVFSQNRMFVLLGDNDVTSRTSYQPGCIVPDNLTENWVLANCRTSHEAGDLIALYPLRASGTVMATKSIGVLVQRYEMYRGLIVDEWVLLDRHNKRMYTHVTVRNATDLSVSYYTSSRVNDTVRRVPPGHTVTVYAYADFDDSRMTSRILCHPMDIQAFFGQSQEESLYTSFLEDGRIHYALSAEDETTHVYVISRDDMIDIPEKLTVRGADYAFDASLNQYVKITGRIRPHEDESPRKKPVPKPFSSTEILLDNIKR